MTAADISLKLDGRTATGKQVAKLRQEGLVPSVVYGGKSEPIHTQSPIVETTKVANKAGKHSPVHLTIDGKKKLAIIKSVDIDPVKHHVRHLAFHTIKQNEIITTTVPIRLVGQGESEAEKAGLVVLQALETLDIKAKPADLPEAFELSIAELATVEDKITLADIKLPEGVEFADVANVYEPSALQAANDAAGGDAEDESETIDAESSEEAAEAETGKKSEVGEAEK